MQYIPDYPVGSCWKIGSIGAMYDHAGSGYNGMTCLVQASETVMVLDSDLIRTPKLYGESASIIEHVWIYVLGATRKGYIDLALVKPLKRIL
jgi:hypothetical protein